SDFPKAKAEMFLKRNAMTKVGCASVNICASSSSSQKATDAICTAAATAMSATPIAHTIFPIMARCLKKRDKERNATISAAVETYRSPQAESPLHTVYLA